MRNHLPPHPGMNYKLKTALLAGLLMASASEVVSAQPIETEGTMPYVAHLVFHPLMGADTAVLAKATAVEAIPARCTALNVSSGGKRHLDGVCVLTDRDGDKIFSTFDTGDIDKSQPKMVCGTHIITAGTGKYQAIPEHEPFACMSIPPLAGPSVQTAMDTTREIK
jgi:hypothetical protein